MSWETQRNLQKESGRFALSATLRGLVEGAGQGLGILTLVSALSFSLACTSAEDSDDPPLRLETVPSLELSGAEPGARQQLEEKRSELDDLLLEAKASEAEQAEAFGELGLLYVTYEFLEAAQVCFSNASLLMPEDYRWPYLQAYLFRARGQLEEARQDFGRALELRPTYLPATLRLGQVSFELGDSEQARTLFEQALSTDTSAVAALEGLGKIAAGEGELEVAVERFQRALALQPEATSLHYSLGQAYRDLGDLEKAQFHLERRGDASPRIADPLLNTLAEAAQGSQFFLVLGAEAMEDENFSAAADAYTQALERDQENLTAYRGLGFCLEKLGDLSGAVTQLEKGARVSIQGGEGEQAQKLEKAEILRLLATFYLRQGRDKAASDQYAASLDLVPGQPAVLLGLGNALARQGRLGEAIGYYDQLLELQPATAATVLEKRATALVNLGRGEEAVRDFRMALEAAPGDARLRLRFAEALEFMGQSEAAAKERAIAQERVKDGPEKAQLAMASARHLASTGDYPSAVAQLREVLKQDPSSVEAHFQLAAVLGHVGEFAEAIEEFRRVLAIQPRHGEARRGLATALILGGRYGEARVELQEGMRLFPRDGNLALVQIRLLAVAPDPDVRDGGLALEVALRLYAERQDAAVRQALALAHAAAGQNVEAVALQSALVAEARAAGRTKAAESLQLKLDAFEAGRPWTARTGEEVLGG